ncbi:Dynactin subunit 4 [Desmophyllum pertusum]|uniref:Dynactin subunit 4 n=1 Tax=Desmophyllum pertusum TaxID=174260 RepID=A0A9W9YPE6_9CNID|nr:Dynactin subunit 4 [Desmophyllum pertusum]
MDNSCESRCFVPTAEVILPTFPLMLGARDEAAEFDEMDSNTPAEMFNDDPRVVVTSTGQQAMVSCESSSTETNRRCKVLDDYAV